jgi:hypothetical protein
VLKLQSRKDEALEWYKKALVFDPRNREAARELADNGIDHVTILRTPCSSHKRYSSDRRQAVDQAEFWIDVTVAWRAAQADGIQDRADLWLVELAIMLRDTDSSVLFCALDDGKRSYAALTDEAVEWLRARVSGVPISHRRGGLQPLPGTNSVFLITGGPGKTGQEEWVAALRELRARRRLAVAGAVLSLAPLCRRELFEPAEGEAACTSLLELFREAAILVVTSTEEARQAKAISRSLEYDIPTIVHAHAFASNGPSRFSPPRSPGTSAFAVLAPWDKAEFDAVLSAWTKCETGSVLLVISATSSPESLTSLNSLLLSRGLSSTSFEVLPPTVDAVRNRLTDCRSLLVPDSRPDGVLWIQDALDLSVPVVSALSSRTMEWFEGAIEDYCDFSDVTQLATRWLNVRLNTNEPHLHRPTAPSLTKTLIKDFRAQMPPELVFGAAPIDIGCFYSFCGNPHTDGSARDGHRYVAGASWSSNGALGVSLAEKCQLRMLVREGFYDRFTYRCLVSGHPGEALLLSTSGTHGERVDEVTWEIPGEGWGWATGHFDCGEDGSVTITISRASQVATESPTGVIVSGFFLYPSAIDRHWFEFLDDVSRGLISLPSVH